MKTNPMSPRLFIGFLILLAIVAATGKILAQETAPQTGPTEELIPEEAQQQKWTQAFQAAEKVFNSETQNDSIALFQNLIADITAEKVKRSLSDAEKLMLVRSLDYLGQAFFLEDQASQAREVFLKLIELEPNYKMNEDLVSPKIIDFVEKIKAENLGILSVTSDPAGATIKIDGNPAGTTNVASLYCLKGEHDIEVGKSGFFPKKDTISVAPGKTQRLNYKLDRSSSVAYFVTYPKGIELVMNGKSLGVTGGEPSDRAQRVATEQNLQVADFSGEFPVADLQPGSYEIQFRKPCWETQARKINIDQNNDFYFEPIVFVPSHATLNVTADDPKANIFIDNDYVGIAPKTQLQVCSGKHVLKIKGAQGKYQKELDLKKDQALTIDAKLNPAMAFLGVMNAGAADKDANAEVIRQLSSLQTLNLQDSSNLEASTSEKVQQLLQSLKNLEPDKSRKAQIQELSGKMEADLLLIGQEKTAGTIDFYLLSGWSSVPDVRTIHSGSADEWKKFNEDLNLEHPLFEKRMGINLIDTSVNQGPVIARVSLKTTDEAQPLTAGDILVAVNNNPVQNAAQAMAAAENLQQVPQITLSVMRSGSKIDVPVKMINGPVEISFEDSRLLYNRQLATFKKVFSLSINPLEKNIALLNTGLCFMHSGEYEDALDQFRQIENLNRPVGIGQGTVKFHMAACLDAEGNRTEADSNLTEASHYPQNTLRSDDGLPLTIEVEQTRKSVH